MCLLVGGAGGCGKKVGEDDSDVDEVELRGYDGGGRERRGRSDDIDDDTDDAWGAR